MTNTFTYTHTPRFNIPSEEINSAVNEFLEKWMKQPLEFRALASDLYLQGVKSGLAKSGYHINKEERIQNDHRT